MTVRCMEIEMEMDVPSCSGSWWSMVLVVRWWVAVDGGKKKRERIVRTLHVTKLKIVRTTGRTLY